MGQAKLLVSEQKAAAASLRGVNQYWKALDQEDAKTLRHREAVGGLWDEIGLLQMTFLRSRGLRPSHFLLDAGCGCLRGGVHFVRYLDAGHYVGLDVNRSLLEAGLRELQRVGLENKDSILIESSQFEFQKAKMVFDYGIAVSLFTHIFINHIARCLVEVKRVLREGGTFYATYFEAPTPVFLETLSHQGGTVTHYDQNPFHISAQELASLASVAELEFERIGEWGHPRGQMMAAFTR